MSEESRIGIVNRQVAAEAAAQIDASRIRLRSSLSRVRAGSPTYLALADIADELSVRGEIEEAADLKARARALKQTPPPSTDVEVRDREVRRRIDLHTDIEVMMRQEEEFCEQLMNWFNKNEEE